MNRSLRVTATLLLATALCGCGALPWDDDDKEVSVALPVVRADLEIVVPAKGYLEALDASPIAVPRVPTGALKVKELVDEGSIVEAGDVVVVFDDTTLNIELDNHRSSLSSADRRIDRNDLLAEIEAGSIEVIREVAQLELDNAETFVLDDTEIFSKLEILETEVRKDEASETILFAEASLLLRGEYYDIEERILGVEKGKVEGDIGRVETSLGKLVLKTPIGGLIVYKKNWRGASVAVGDTIWPGNVILSIVDPASSALTAFLLEKDASGVEVGDDASVILDARPQHTFQGRVHTVAEISRPIERGSPVKYTEIKIEFLDADVDLLKPGMKGEARIVTGSSENAVVIPRTALRGDPKQPFVLVEGIEGNERRPVTLGPGNLVLVSIEDGLEEGERVVLGGEDPLVETPAPETAPGSGGAVAAAGV